MSEVATVSISNLIRFAHRLAQEARQETLSRRSVAGQIDDKGSASTFDPVTDADREAERAMRALIEEAYPDHGISGEEFGEKPSASAYRWSLDPVDGTRSYICGLPTWVTLIALLRDEEPLIGVIDAPCLGETYIGALGETLLETQGSAVRLRSSVCTILSDARLSTTDPYLFNGAAANAFKRLRSATRTVRFGHDGYAYARLAAGTLDLVVESGLKEHDYNALIPVVRGAGGVIGDWQGGSDFAPGNLVAAATPQLYETAVAFMRDAA